EPSAEDAVHSPRDPLRRSHDRGVVEASRESIRVVGKMFAQCHGVVVLLSRRCDARVMPTPRAQVPREKPATRGTASLLVGPPVAAWAKCGRKRAASGCATQNIFRGVDLSQMPVLRFADPNRYKSARGRKLNLAWGGSNLPLIP